MATGGWAGPGAKFRVVVEIGHDTQRDDDARVLVRRYVQVSDGSHFAGTILSTSWAGQVRLYEGGTYADSGWCALGTYGYGHYEAQSAKANYTSYSGAYHESSATAEDWNGAPTWTPYAIDNLKGEKRSSTEVKFTWSNHPHGARPYSGIYADIRIDHGQWSNVATLGGGTGSFNAGGLAADHCYEWRFVPYNGAGQPGHTYSSEIYTAPSAPKITSIARTSNTKVKVTLANDSRVATSLEYQSRKQGDTAWGQWSTKTTVDGLTTSFETDLGGGTFQVRARNVRGSLTSDWCDPVSVVTICPPAAPSLISPTSSAVVEVKELEVTFAWRHNPRDGSPQTAAQVEIYSPGYDNRTENIVGSASSLTVDNDFGHNATVKWRVRTKGADAEWGDWSGYRIFGTAARPTVVIESPAEDAVVTDMPLGVKLTYVDTSGTFVRAAVDVLDEDSAVVYSDSKTSTEFSIGTSDWVPEDGKSYRLRVIVRSTSGLTATTERAFSIKFLLPQRGVLDVVPSPEDGTATVRIMLSHDPDLARAVSISLYRIRGETRTEISADAVDGAEIVDRYCPLNTDFAYEVVTTSAMGAVNVNRVDGRLETPWWFIIYDGGVAKAMWEPSGTVTPERPADELKECDGRTWPVLVQGRRKSLKIKFSGWLDDQDGARMFRDMALAAGDKVYKGLSGDVWHCHAEAEVKEEYDGYADFEADVDVTVTRVDGGDL